MANRNTAIRGIQIRDNDITLTQLATSIGTSLGKADSAYQLPVGGVPSADMASAVQTSLGKADSAYQLPVGGVPSADMASAVQTSLGLADSALQEMGAFTELTDVPASYSGQGGKGVRVNSGATALEFYSIVDTTGILEGAVAIQDFVVSAKVGYTMATLAVANSVQAYLNGLLQEEGSGKDYIYSEAGGKSVLTFAEATEVGDILVVHSITKA